MASKTNVVADNLTTDKTKTGVFEGSKGSDVASANDLTLGTDGNYFDITGTTSITSIGTLGIGTVVTLHFDGALTLTHHAADLILPGGANITTAAEDEAMFVEYATGDWRCVAYTKASGEAVVGAGLEYADVLEIIRQMHPNVFVLSGAGVVSTARLDGAVYKIWDQWWIDSAAYSETSESYVVQLTKNITTDLTNVVFYCDIKGERTDTVDIGVYVGYTVNSDQVGDVTEITHQTGMSPSQWYNGKSKEIVAGLSNGDVLRIWLHGSNVTHVTAYFRNFEIKANEAGLSGIVSATLAANAAVLSFFSHLKGKFSNGASSHATPIQVEIFGNGDSYAAALNATTKFKIDVADPRIELYRIDDSVVAKSGAQENWVLDDNATNGAFAAKTTSTHETILGEEIGCASVVMVEKSVNGAFTDTEILVEDDDYTVDYSTRTATKIILTASEATDIVNAQSKLRITWIADVEDVEGTANTALKMKIYLNRTDTTEASPEIQKIDLGTDKYAEMQYMCG